MGLSLGQSVKAKDAGNRRVPRQPSGEKAERPKTRPSAPAKANKSVKPLKRQSQVSGTRAAFRRVVAVLWPERYPELAAARASRRSGERQTPKGFIWVWALAVIVAAAAFIGHLHVRFDIIQTGYSLSQSQAEQRRLRLTQRELRLELATLKEPGRIETQAREDLGMERPEHDRIIRLDERRGARRRGR